MVKLINMIDTFNWHEQNDMLAAIGDGKLNVWYYPNSIYINRSIFEQSKAVKDVA